MALGLLERGVRDCVLLEAQSIGFGASGRTGDFVSTGFSLEPTTDFLTPHL
jgi:gamma-glutamylputrescine oxidase